MFLDVLFFENHFYLGTDSPDKRAAGSLARAHRTKTFFQDSKDRLELSDRRHPTKDHSSPRTNRSYREPHKSLRQTKERLFIFKLLSMKI